MDYDPITRLGIDGLRMHVPAAWTGTIDVSFDGRRVFSFDPRRHPRQPGGYRIVSWPRQFHTYLSGRSLVSLSQHSDGAALGQLEMTFGNGRDRVAFVDSEGFELAADKWGRLSRTFDSLGAGFGERILDDLAELLTDTEEILGRPSFIAYGTLLGAVREGTFIGHDTDADISYLSQFEHPTDIAREAYSLRRGLHARGYRTHPSTSTFLQVWRGQDTPAERRIDIFTSYFLGDHFSMDCWVRGPLRRDDILPLSTVELAGRDMPAPAAPEAVLEITYGPRWRTPDPAFKFAVPRSTSARAYGYFGSPVVQEAITVAEDLRPPAVDEDLRPSDFAVWVQKSTSADARMVDLRPGVGHDAIWWATQGRSVQAFDVKNNSRAFALDHDRLVDRLTLERLPLGDLRRTLTRAAQIADNRPTVVTVRRTLEGISAQSRYNLLALVRVLLGGGGQLYLEDDVQSPGLRQVIERLRLDDGVSVRESIVQSADSDGGPVMRVVVEWPPTPLSRQSEPSRPSHSHKHGRSAATSSHE